MPYRTSDLCRVKAVKCILACTSKSRNYAVLQVFYEPHRSRVSAASAPVPARLQYGCSKKPQARKPGAFRFPSLAGTSWWAMLGSNQRSLPCEGSKIACWEFLELAECLQMVEFLCWLF